jgi:hypothetical protein
MRQLFLHVGIGKAGSSALQYAFSKATEDFAARGLTYPQTPEARQRVAMNQPIGLGNAAAIRKAFRTHDPDTAIKLTLDLVGSCNGDILLSNETLFGTRPKDLQALKAALTNVGVGATKVLVFFRPQVELFAAAYVQARRSRGAEHDDENSFAIRRHETGLYDWLACAKKYEAVFGQGTVKVCWYPAVVRTHGVIKEAFDWLGVRVPHIEQVVNPTPGYEVIEVLSLAKDIKRYDLFCYRFLTELQRSGLRGTKVILNEQVTRRIEAETRDSNAELLRHYCPELSVERELAPAKSGSRAIDPNLLRQVTDIAAKVAIEVGPSREAAERTFGQAKT